MMLKTVSPLQFTSEEAIEIARNELWKGLTPRELAILQLSQENCFCSFADFQMAVEELVGRSVWTHELINARGLLMEGLKRLSEEKKRG